MRQFFAILILLVTCTIATGTSVVVKKYRTQGDFAGGKTRGVSIRHDGVLALAPQTREIRDLGISQIWDIARREEMLLLACGGPAALVELNTAGDTTQLYRGDQAALFAVAVDRQGAIWFAPAPGGDIFRRQHGVTQKVTTLEVKYVWDILPGEKELLVATGIPGLILRLQANGAVDTVYNSQELHIRILVRDSMGHVYAGSSDNGLIFKIDPQGKVSVLYDSPQTEIFALLPMADGEIWAAGGKEGPQLPAQASPQVTATGITIEDQQNATTETQIISPRDTGRSFSRRSRGAGMVYRISADGYAREMWQDQSERVQSLAPGPENSVLVGTGDSGKLYCIDAEGQISLLADLEPAQITAILATGKKTYLGTSNLGQCIELSESTVSRGEYESEVIDANIQATWGSLSWRGQGKLTFYTRSGNSSEPDATWSPWGRALQQSTGSAIDAPPARFLQWRAVLERQGTEEPLIRAVDVGYLPKNIAPEITEVKLHERGTVFPDAMSKGLQVRFDDRREANNGQRNRRNHNLGKQEERPGYLSISWDAKDANGDEVVFDLYYRPSDAQQWRLMARDFRSTAYSWDSRTMPDGEYVIKIVASDREANPPEQAQSVEKLSEPFVIDNTPPQILDAAIDIRRDEITLRFRAEDTASRIIEAYYALDAGRWIAIHPTDGVADSRSERFSVRLSGVDPGAHTLTLKVYDENENIQYAHLNFQR